MTTDDRGVLLIVDVQNDFCPGGALAVPQGDEIIPIVNRLAASYAHVILTQDWHPPGHASFASSHPGKSPFETIEVAYGQQVLWPDHCVQGTPGAVFHFALDIPHAELVLRKGFRSPIDSYSAFRENDRRNRDRARWLPQGARVRTRYSMRARDRFLRGVFCNRRASGRV